MGRKANWMLVDGRVRKIKPEFTLEYMQGKYPDKTIQSINSPPSIACMEEWISNCVAEALDGCRVEPDGICQHDFPSWLLALGYI